MAGVRRQGAQSRSVRVAGYTRRCACDVPHRLPDHPAGRHRRRHHQHRRRLRLADNVPHAGGARVPAPAGQRVQQRRPRARLVSGVHGYRRELVGQRSRLRRLVPASILGALTGATLLLVLPSSLFDKVVIVLICVALALVVVQPTLSRRLAARRAARPGRRHDATPGVQVLVALAGVYGGYFGAAQGIILISILGIMIDDHLQRLNGLKNVLAGSVNAVGRDRLHPHHRRRLEGGRGHRRGLHHRWPDRRPVRPPAQSCGSARRHRGRRSHRGRPLALTLLWS